MALAKAQNGNVGALGRLGIATKDANGKTKSFAQIQDDLAEQFGGAASAKAEHVPGQDGPAQAGHGRDEGSHRREAAAGRHQVGYVVPEHGPARDLVGSANYMRDTFGPIIGKIRDIISSVFGGASGSEIGGVGLQHHVDLPEFYLYLAFDLWNIFGGTITTFVKAIFGNIKQIIGGALNVIAGIFKVISSVLKGDWKGAWEGIKQIVKGAWSVIKGIVNGGWNVIKGVFKAAGNALKAIFGASGTA